MSAKLDQLELSPFHTKIEGFHQIIAVTQAYINSQLKQQWAASEKLQHLEIMLPPCELKKRVKGKLLADTGPMQIQLGVEAENHTVYCHLHLTKGQSVVYEGDEDTSISIDNWVVVLKANVNLLSEDMERVPERITKRLGNAGHYSIKKVCVASSCSKRRPWH
ncbi:hypothetical protein FS749_003312 [Ceratobasidium sp. UAMH 11750]|nr:hypothetical protein FS749_003312 [Ceratobasidium sp. UAMH 11750]